MMLSIIGIFIGLLLVLPRFLMSVAECEKITDKPFVCPNCGKEFYVNWYKMWYKRISVRLWEGAKLKCPNCGMTDMCKHKD